MFGLARKRRRPLCHARIESGASTLQPSVTSRNDSTSPCCSNLSSRTLCPTQQEQEAILYTKDDHEALDWVGKGTGTAALLAQCDQGQRSPGRGFGGRTDAAQVDVFLPQAADRDWSSTSWKDRASRQSVRTLRDGTHPHRRPRVLLSMTIRTSSPCWKIGSMPAATERHRAGWSRPSNRSSRNRRTSCFWTSICRGSRAWTSEAHGAEQADGRLPVIVMTAHGSIPAAVEAMKVRRLRLSDQAARQRPPADRDSKGAGAGFVEAPSGLPRDPKCKTGMPPSSETARRSRR